MRKFRSIFAAFAAAALMVMFASSAQAEVTIGQLAPGLPAALCSQVQIDSVPFLAATGHDYVVPENGVLTSWSTKAAAGPGQMLTLKVFRPQSDGSFTVVAHDGPRALTGGVVNTFKVHIPVQTSDVIGLNSANDVQVSNACEFLGENPPDENNDIVDTFAGDAADGVNLAPNARDFGFRANVTAEFLAPPEIDIFNRVPLGSVEGGAAVPIQGNHFEAVLAVMFGGVAAPRFTVSDEHHLTAIAPPGRTLGEINAEVITAAGTATAPSRFSYSGCLVPKLAGKPLAAAKKQLANGGCKLGKVARVHGSPRKRGKVLTQSPKPGSLLAPGSKVGLKVGK